MKKLTLALSLVAMSAASGAFAGGPTPAPSDDEVVAPAAFGLGSPALIAGVVAVAALAVLSSSSTTD
jgi:hypothetical protein